MLVGWRGWWSRMELKCEQDEAKQTHDEGWMEARMTTNNQLRLSFIQKFHCDKNMEGEDGTGRMEKSQEGRRYAPANVVNKDRQ